MAATYAAASAMHRAFHHERRYVGASLCPCRGCTEVARLRLKFVAHVGEVATQTIRQRRKLVGIDVILVHRMLKNSVSIPEYVLMSEDLHRLGDGVAPETAAHEVSEDLEGIGSTRSFAVDVADLTAFEPPPSAGPNLLARLGRTFTVAGAGLPAMLGLRRRTVEAS
ncbi:DUF2652 domain-containing protein [Nocardioides abyssi]|uniref:DUF2652 domain-containing protein n=1 Tax=Nocardioides abyssi TaxID=3058370 RepID=A0ABT8EZ79_9ACTN|nr:DUF2652 domain-containing protein [Nocardioides abyssi]MDN4163500.1 DUF2652 domain-containing protein [Nocardioides abyssi]